MRKLLVLSGKGGTGKTTVAAALIRLLRARAFADCDVDAPNLHLLHSFVRPPERRPFRGADKAFVDAAVCRGCGACAARCRFGALTRGPDGTYRVSPYACEGCGVCALVCPAGAARMTEDMAGDLSLYRDDRTFSTAELRTGRGNSGKLVTEVKDTLFRAAPDEPFAVLDGSPGIGCPVIASLNGADLALLVAEPTLAGRHDLERVAGTCALAGVPAAVCVNRYDLNEGVCDDIEAWCAEGRLPFLGRIPYDRQAARAVNEGRSLSELDGPAAAALRRIAMRAAALLRREGT